MSELSFGIGDNETLHEVHALSASTCFGKDKWCNNSTNVDCMLWYLHHWLKIPQSGVPACTWTNQSLTERHKCTTLNHKKILITCWCITCIYSYENEQMKIPNPSMHTYNIAVATITSKTDSFKLLPDEGSKLLVLEGWEQATEWGRGVASAREKSWLRSS